MPNAYLGEIRILAGGRVPFGWKLCDGRELSVDDHPDLFSLIGTRFGGSGSTFALPDLRGRSPLGAGPLYALGTVGGRERVTLSQNELPPHRHVLRASAADGTSDDPTGHVWAASDARPYGAKAGAGAFAAGALTSAGAGEAHENMMPFLGVTFVISIDGAPPQFGAIGDTFIGEVRLFAFDLVPDGWLPCDGSALLPVHDALAAEIGTAFSPAGLNVPCAPDLRDRFPLHASTALALQLGATGGAHTHALTTAELPSHTHAPQASTRAGDAPYPTGRLWGRQTAALAYAEAPTTNMAADAVGASGAGAGHDNMPPFLALNACIAFAGEAPSNANFAVEPWTGEVRALATLPPLDWALCNGDALPVSRYDNLVPELGVAYGQLADAVVLPDLQGRVALGAGGGVGLTARARGDRGGAAQVALTLSEVPSHTHDVQVAAEGGRSSPEGAVFGPAQARALSAGYSSAAADTALSTAAVSSAGDSAPHENMAPYLSLNFCLALLGVAVS